MKDDLNIINEQEYDFFCSYEDFYTKNSYATGVYRVLIEKSHIDILISGFDNINSGSSVLVCFTAAVSNRNNKKAPFFSGMGVSSKFNLPLISIADPTVSEYPVGLAWYAGNEKSPKLPLQISDLLAKLYSKLDFKQYIMLGGSGAGFACLTQSMLNYTSKIKAIVINPQTSIIEYKISSVQNYISHAFKKDIKNKIVNKETAHEILLKNDIFFEIDINKITSESDVIYLQNESDWHVESHLIPFISNSHVPWYRIGKCSFHNKDNLSLYIGSWGKNHAKPPKELIFHIIKGFIDGKSSSCLAKSLEDQLISFAEDSNFYDNSIFDIDWNIQHLINDTHCKIKVSSATLEYLNNIKYAFYLIVDNTKIVSKKFYTYANHHTFHIEKYNNKKLSIKVFIKLPNGRKITKNISVRNKESSK